MRLALELFDYMSCVELEGICEEITGNTDLTCNIGFLYCQQWNIL